MELKKKKPETLYHLQFTMRKKTGWGLEESDGWRQNDGPSVFSIPSTSHIHLRATQQVFPISRGVVITNHLLIDRKHNSLSFWLTLLLLFLKTDLSNWRLITLQYCGVCDPLTWISHGCTCSHHPESPSLPITLGCPRAPALGALLLASKSGCRRLSVPLTLWVDLGSCTLLGWAKALLFSFCKARDGDHFRQLSPKQPYKSRRRPDEP